MKETRRIYLEILAEVQRKLPKFKAEIGTSPDIEQRHQMEPRVFAWSLPSGKIEVCKDFETLTPSIQYGIMWHEFGHLIHKYIKAETPTHPLLAEIGNLDDELIADFVIETMFGVRIFYSTNQKLQTVIEIIEEAE